MSKQNKIGCVVIMHPGQNNYGTSLQGFATIKKVEEFGYDYDIIRYRKRRNFLKIVKLLPELLSIGLVDKILLMLSLKCNMMIHKEYRRTRRIRGKAVQSFKDKYFETKSRYFTGYKNLQQGSKEYSVVMVGSDQVWGPFSLYNGFYNLIFVDKPVPTFSYASSFGISTIPACQHDKVAEYLRKLDMIGVREQRGKEIVKELTGREAQVVLDPTLLLTKEQWESYIEEDRCKVEGDYILCYILGERKDIRESVTRFGKETSIKIVNLPHIDNYHAIDDDFGDEHLFDVGPFDFIRLIRDAKYVVTDSFHGSAFSILMQKKFMTFYRQQTTVKGSTHSRIDSLFNIFGITERICKNGELNGMMQKDIDYTAVNAKVQEMRVQSSAFLEKALRMSEKGK